MNFGACLRCWRRVAAPVCALLLAIAPAAAGPSDLAPPEGLERLTQGERTAALTPLYQQLAQRQAFAERRKAIQGNLGDQAAVDAYLRYLPISPLELTRIEMELKRIEFAMPRLIVEWHQRWIALDPERARRQYGDRYVDRRLALSVAGFPSEADATAERSSGATNRNASASSTPLPDAYQGETQVAANPANANEIVMAANTQDAMGGACGDLGIQAIYRSTDGGQSWSYDCAPAPSAYSISFFGGQTCAQAGGQTFGSDPALAWDSHGNVFLEYMLLCFDGAQYDINLVVARSTDGGASWSPHGVVSTSFADKNFYAIDNNPTSPYYDRHYSCWKNGADSNNRVSYSADGGQTWTEVLTPDVAGTTAVEFSCDVAVAADGTVHLVTWAQCYTGCYGPQLAHSVSTDGGATWRPSVVASDLDAPGFLWFPPAQDTRGINVFGTVDLDNSGGVCDGTIYAVYSDAAAPGYADLDAFVVRSTDGGLTWSSPVAVASTAPAGSLQFHPTLDVDDDTGRVVVAWQDTRQDPTNQQVEVLLSVSGDCGASFGSEVSVTQPSTEFNNPTVAASNENSTANPNANYNQYGDYMAVDARGGQAYVSWTDSRHFHPGSTTDPQVENVAFAALSTSGLAAPVTLTLTSHPTEDGWIRERNENANYGWRFNATNSGSAALRVGDDKKDRQWKSVVSFDTSVLPAGAQLISAELRLQRGKLVGSDPFATHGGLNVDLTTPGFSGSPTLQTSDFEATATVVSVTSLSPATANGDWSSGLLSAAGLAAIDTAGTTQFRLAFDVDDDDDRIADYLGYHSSRSGNASKHPQLVVTYRP